MRWGFLSILTLLFACNAEEAPQVNHDPFILGTYKRTSSPDINHLNLSAPEVITISKGLGYYWLSYNSDIDTYFDGVYAPNDGIHRLRGVAVKKHFGKHSPTLAGRVVEFNYYKSKPVGSQWYLEFNVHHWEGEDYTLLRIGGYYSKTAP